VLTDAQCRQALAGEKERKLSDAHGLFLRISPTGSKSPAPGRRPYDAPASIYGAAGWSPHDQPGKFTRHFGCFYKTNLMDMAGVLSYRFGRAVSITTVGHTISSKRRGGPAL
jgi:hypothetical protein